MDAVRFNKWLRSTALPLLIGSGVVATVLAAPAVVMVSESQAANPCAARNPCGARNPCAGKNPCGAGNPCAAKNPCGAGNPCAAKAAATSDCVVPRLVDAMKGGANPCGAANPCAAKNPCAGKNPCGAANPCAGKNPCGAANPCAAKNPCGAANPCAGKNPCGAANPCAAKNPCGAANPCGASEVVKITDDEAAKVYDCLIKDMKAGYGISGLKVATAHFGWTAYNKVPYVSSTHGGRYVNNQANQTGSAYGKFEKAGVLPKGSILAKNSFSVNPDGHAVPGPLFLMEKMQKGFNPESGDWRFTMVMPAGNVVGTTNGKGSDNVQFCVECHAAVGKDQDHLFFLPPEYRKGS